MTDLIPIFFYVMFAVAIVIIAVTGVKGFRQRRANDAAPVQEMAATVSGKRAPGSSALRPKAAEASGQGCATRTTYYAAFQTGDGNRMEFQVSQADYNRLAEGEQGTLTFQGTRYLGFQREEAAKSDA